MAYGARDGVPHFEDGSGNIGPYIACDGDAISTASIDQFTMRHGDAWPPY